MMPEVGIRVRYATGSADLRHPEVPTFDVPPDAGERFAPPRDVEPKPLVDRMPGERFAIAPAARLYWGQGMHVTGMDLLVEDTWPVAELVPPEGS